MYLRVRSKNPNLNCLQMVAYNKFPPDGGWGWIVVFGIALTNTFNQSLISVFGLLFSDHLDSLGQNTTGAALVMNLNSVCLNLTGLITGPAIQMLSARKVAIIGSIFTGTGMILSSQTKFFWQFLVTYGILVGFGLGLISSSTFIMVNSYFKENRGKAVGFALAGTGIGQMIMPHIVSFLLKEYGYRGASLIIGGLALHGLVGAFLCQPVEWHMKKKQIIDEQKYLLISEESSHSDVETDTASVQPIQAKVETPFWEQVKLAMNFKFLRDPLFLSISVGLALAYTASINFSMIFPYFLQKTAKLSRDDAAMCMSILASADLSSRLTLPSITDKLKITARTTFLVGAILLMGIRTLLAETTEQTTLILFSGIYGYVRALTIVNQSLVISEYTTQDKLPGALGLNMVIKGIFVITVGQFLGWIRDYSQSYVISLYCQNILLLIVIMIWLPEICYRNIKRKPKAVIESTE